MPSLMSYPRWSQSGENMWGKWISQDGTPPPAVPAQFERCESFLSFREVAIQGNMRAGSATRLPFCQPPHSPPSFHTPLLLLVNKPMTVLLKEEVNINIFNCISARSILFLSLQHDVSIFGFQTWLIDEHDDDQIIIFEVKYLLILANLFSSIIK